MKRRRIAWTLAVLFLLSALSCSNLPGIKGKFSEPVKGKALSLIVRRVSGAGPNLSLMLEISNPSAQKVIITPLKVRVIDEKGSETETTYNSTRKSLGLIEFAGGSIIEGTLSVTNPNQNQPAQLGAPAALAPGESVSMNLEPSGKANPKKVQVSIGPAGTNEQEIFAITK